MSKLIDVRVTTVTAELNLIIPSKSTGRSLFDKIVLTLGIQETWHFGIVFVDIDGHHRWLKMDKKILKIKFKDKKLMKFNFLVKYYPEDVTDELIQNITISLFYFQIRENILRGDIFCPPEIALLLASLTCQVKFGDYNPEIHKPGMFLNDRILPDRILKQYQWSISKWEETIIKWYSEHLGMFPEEAMLEYLKLAQDLEMYGVSYFQIVNKRGSSLHLGIDAMGLNIYKYSDKLNPQVGFPWNEIKNISFSDLKFVIKSVEKSAPDFVFYSQDKNVNKNIIDLCSGNHQLFVRRRDGDSVVVKDMKSLAMKDRLMKASERERLLDEKNSREMAERKLQILEEQLDNKRSQLSSVHKALESCVESSGDIMRKLELENHHEEQLKTDETDATTKDQIFEEITENSEIETSAVIKENYDINNESINEIPKPQIKISKKSAISFKEYEQKTSIIKDYKERLQSVIVLNKVLLRRLKDLELELKEVKNSEPFDEFDAIHAINKAQGMDKFETLRKIKLGNTKKRVDTFESM